jgi:hypothetical protein
MRSQLAAPWRRRRGRLAAVLAVVAPLGLVGSRAGAGVSNPPHNAPASAPAVSDPLAGSVANPSTTWASMTMGRNDGQFDLFWQLFSLDVTTGRFALVTPPGVASNGGLMVGQAGEGSSVLIGFGVSRDLVFSPLALSTNNGRTWSPGGLEQGLVSVPSALGFDEQGDALAVVSGSTPAILERSGSLTSWKTDVSRASLAATAAGKRCQVGALEGVAVASGDSALVGASCRGEGVPGIFDRDGATWRLAAIPVPASLESDAFAVLRLAPSSGLLAAVGHTTSVVAVWQPSSSASWSLSSPLALPNSRALLATGTGPGGRQFVLWRQGETERADVIDGPGARWQPLVALPGKTATIAFLPNGHVDALSVDETRLAVWRLGADGKSWEKVQAMTVPIAFGSSG